MKTYKKQILLGIICLTSILLQCIPLKGFSAIAGLVSYLAFCLCSLVVGLKDKKGVSSIIILLSGLVLLPIFDSIYSRVSIFLMTSLFADILIMLIQSCVYFVLFIFINAWIRKEKFSFSLITGILAILCVVVYSVFEGLNSMAFTNAMNQALEQGSMINWLSLMSALNTNSLFNTLSKTAFYVALWGTSIRFIKDN